MSSSETRPRRPFGVQALALLLTIYAMGAVYIVAAVASNRSAVPRWELVAAGSALFAASAGVAAGAVWQLTATAPRWLIVCAACGAVLCLAMGAARDAIDASTDVWRAAITGAILFVAFLALAARYVRLQIDARS
jgi:hypothetical protein